MRKKPQFLPQEYVERISDLLRPLGYDLMQPKAVADAILRLSDFYLKNPTSQSPWHQPWAQAAYLAYFFPLNYLRAQAVVQEGLQRKFFANLRSFVDFGSGLGSASLALTDHVESSFATGLAVEIASEASRLHQMLLPDSLKREIRHLKDIHNAAELPRPQTRLAILSYVYTEMKRLPSWIIESEAILIIEPSTREDGRRLMELRETLLRAGYYVWAPCTHQSACPLLHHSKKDWCHDRIHWEQPAWWQAIERRLPMKNSTLTFSYLLMRRSPPLMVSPHYARLTGDPLKEKGKARQLVCRGSEREFLAWFPKRVANVPVLDRGMLVELDENIEKRADELRPTEGQVQIIE